MAAKKTAAKTVVAATPVNTAKAITVTPTSIYRVSLLEERKYSNSSPEEKTESVDVTEINVLVSSNGITTVLASVDDLIASITATYKNPEAVSLKFVGVVALDAKAFNVL